MKYVLVIGDGMADNPVAELNGKTPLQYAHTPAMDALASAGTIGTVLTIPEGMQAGSDTAILSIFGCDPRKCFSGRAPLEAAATGIRLEPGDIAYRCNLITIEDGDMPFEDKKIISHSSGAIEGDISDELILDLFQTSPFAESAREAGVAIYPGSSFRHIAVQSKNRISVTGDRRLEAGGQTKGLSMPETGDDDTSEDSLRLTPPHDHINETLGQHLPKGGRNAAVLEGLMRIAHKILDIHPINTKRRRSGKHPANGIWLWAEGTSVELPNFTGKYGKTGVVISAVPLCQGIGTLIGLKKIIVEGATGELHTNYEGKVEAALEALKTNDFAAIHIEAPDECTHNGDLEGKLQAIKWIDSRIIAPLTDKLAGGNTDYRLMLISDHRTLMSTRGHDGAPVPFLLYDSRVDQKMEVTYCEQDSVRGRNVASGTELMDILFETKRPRE